MNGSRRNQTSRMFEAVWYVISITETLCETVASSTEHRQKDLQHCRLWEFKSLMQRLSAQDVCLTGDCNLETVVYNRKREVKREVRGNLSRNRIFKVRAIQIHTFRYQSPRMQSDLRVLYSCILEAFECTRTFMLL